ncbi:MAG: hypothetical protein HOF33_00635, partial [Rhodospirillaceae bacterium]|nr:hypothetical protein [Rhodospirillaceae bacterium]
MTILMTDDIKPLNPLQWFKHRLRGRADSEHEQIIVRIAFYVVILAHMTVVATVGTDHLGAVQNSTLLAFGGLGLSLLFLAHLLIWRGPSIPRRAVAMLFDTGGMYLFLNIGE